MDSKNAFVPSGADNTRFQNLRRIELERCEQVALYQVGVFF